MRLSLPATRISPRATDRCGVRADTGRREPASLRQNRRAGRRGDRRRRALVVEVGGQPRVRLAHARAPDRADEPPAGRSPPGGADARRDRTQGPLCVVGLGSNTDGVQHPLGVWDGSTENATVVTTLLANLVERGLDVEQGVLVGWKPGCAGYAVCSHQSPDRGPLTSSSASRASDTSLDIAAEMGV